ncbi:hypothetical protein B0H16DRAFT_1465180 [Mycena metata]|uniref:DNA helicase Pif1-like 2B domain-containing protein n=1 Tax=Mycena metata TaxID=1033252 RepID=A0AAD7IBQ8_9AGAR|nr:hypothetical protein B0H16DRAFT_1465180 [Mycena metata]
MLSTSGAQEYSRIPQYPLSVPNKTTLASVIVHGSSVGTRTITAAAEQPEPKSDGVRVEDSGPRRNLQMLTKLEPPELNEDYYPIVIVSTLKAFTLLERPLVFSDGPEATELFPLRRDVESANHQRLMRLQTPSFEFNADDSGAVSDPERRRRLLANVPAPSHIILRVGAQVMLVKNRDQDLVNGSVGFVVGFTDPDAEVIDDRRTLVDDPAFLAPGARAFPLVSFSVPGGGVREILVLPELFTVQLPSGQVQVSRFQVYVALSRAVSMDGLQVLHFSPEKVRAHPRVIAWCMAMAARNEAPL